MRWIDWVGLVLFLVIFVTQLLSRLGHWKWLASGRKSTALHPTGGKALGSSNIVPMEYVLDHEQSSLFAVRREGPLISGDGATPRRLGEASHHQHNVTLAKSDRAMSFFASPMPRVNITDINEGVCAPLSDDFTVRRVPQRSNWHCLKQQDYDDAMQWMTDVDKIKAGMGTRAKGSGTPLHRSSALPPTSFSHPSTRHVRNRPIIGSHEHSAVELPSLDPSGGLSLGLLNFGDQLVPLYLPVVQEPTRVQDDQRVQETTLTDGTKKRERTDHAEEHQQTPPKTIRRVEDEFSLFVSPMTPTPSYGTHQNESTTVASCPVDVSDSRGRHSSSGLSKQHRGLPPLSRVCYKHIPPEQWVTESSSRLMLGPTTDQALSKSSSKRRGRLRRASSEVNVLAATSNSAEVFGSCNPQTSARRSALLEEARHSLAALAQD